ncbi:hypothetical protein ABFA07_015379 [Porites harrisoni]
MLARGKYSCELNNSTHGEHERDLVPDQDHFYRGTKNACSNSPCQNNGTCQSGFTKKGIDVCVPMVGQVEHVTWILMNAMKRVTSVARMRLV